MWLQVVEYIMGDRKTTTTASQHSMLKYVCLSQFIISEGSAKQFKSNANRPVAFSILHSVRITNLNAGVCWRTWEVGVRMNIIDSFNQFPIDFVCLQCTATQAVSIVQNVHQSPPIESMSMFICSMSIAGLFLNKSWEEEANLCRRLVISRKMALLCLFLATI